MTLSQDEIFRYTRQLPLLTLQGQEKLKNAHVAIVGCGGLGCPAMINLCSSGVGKLTLLDGDAVELSNLARQTLYTTPDLGHAKVESAREHLQALNPHCNLTAHNLYVEATNVASLIGQCDAVLDASDNFTTRYLLNHYCRLHSIPLISASVFQFQAQLGTFNFEGGPCYECLYPTQPENSALPNCALGGVLGALTGMVGSLQALETIKIITGLKENLAGQILTIDASQLHFKTFKLEKSPHCNLHTCTKEATMSNPTPEEKAPTLTPKETLTHLTTHPKVVLLDVREPFECEICKLEDAKTIPLGTLAEKAKELDPSCCYIVYCKAGLRGNKGALLLKKMGFPQVYNLEGGILRWIDEIDCGLKKY